MDAPRLLVQTGHAMLRAPRSWSLPQWLRAAAFTCALVLAFVYERGLQSVIEAHGGAAAGVVARLINICGGGVVVACIGMAGFAAGRMLKSDALIDAAIVFGAAGVWCFLLTELGQFVLAERRPMFGAEMRFFSVDGHGVSGHASAAALFALPVRDVWLRKSHPAVRHLAMIVLVVWSLAVAWSRVWLGMHSVWNVLLGLALGRFTSAAAITASES